MYFDRPYYEPNAYEEIILEYQQRMKDVLLEGIKFEIENIKKENEELKKRNQKLIAQKQKVEQKERELQSQKEDLMRQVKRERLGQLLGDCELVMYKVITTSIKPPKCDKCDQNRKIYFQSPSGKSMSEDCLCNIGKKAYTPFEHVCTEFRVNNDNNKLLMWYKVNRDGDYDWCSYESSSICKTVYNENMKYEDLKQHYDLFFKSKEECQKYCDWLNQNNH